jgi:hypothetical protein
MLYTTHNIYMTSSSRFWLLLSLPTYKFDYPSFAPPFAEDGISRATRQSSNKISSATATVLFHFVSHDKHTFCTSNGSHGSDGLKLSAVFDNRNTKNLHRIEDGIYPERVLPRMHPTEMLNQVFPPDSPLLTA